MGWDWGSQVGSGCGVRVGKYGAAGDGIFEVRVWGCWWGGRRWQWGLNLVGCGYLM